MNALFRLWIAALVLPFLGFASFLVGMLIFPLLPFLALALVPTLDARRQAPLPVARPRRAALSRLPQPV